MPKVPVLLFHVRARNLAYAALAIYLAAITVTEGFSKPTCPAVRQAFYDAEIEMHGVGCIGCIRRIERELRHLKGVIHVEAKQARGGVVVQIKYDSTLLPMQSILRQIAHETDDYKVTRNKKVAK